MGSDDSRARCMAGIGRPDYGVALCGTPSPRAQAVEECPSNVTQLECSRVELRFHPLPHQLRSVSGKGSQMSIERRGLLKSIAGAGALALAPRITNADEQVARATRGTPPPRIRDISVIECQPDGVRLTVVKITTDQPGLYGYGCATFTQRADLVKPAVEKYLKPFLLNKTTDRIEDIWQSCYDSSYWKNGPVLNNALSGIDQALWDIKGRQAGMPVYQLAGGKCREAAACYGHAEGADYKDTVASAKRYIAQGFRHVRVQVGVPGMAAYGSAHSSDKRPKALHDQPIFEPGYAMRRNLKLLEFC